MRMAATMWSAPRQREGQTPKFTLPFPPAILSATPRRCPAGSPVEVAVVRAVSVSSMVSSFASVFYQGVAVSVSCTKRTVVRYYSTAYSKCSFKDKT